MVSIQRNVIRDLQEDSMKTLRGLPVCLLATLPLNLCHAEESVLISCEGSPADAILTLPPPLDRWGQI
jgi:hypothetical protein